ncbi:hypothetical protein CDAR_52011 [Caerostris darwini]|uniref:Uncharacterized protein n=1 Tax=Caerostris darwini TaxID=1538125 RepID=A0AAV4N040_9ARAC|nr:hypothetical protein CDAR_52011 [Caerostris darwini]
MKNNYLTLFSLDRVLTLPVAFSLSSSPPSSPAFIFAASTILILPSPPIPTSGEDSSETALIGTDIENETASSLPVMLPLNGMPTIKPAAIAPDKHLHCLILRKETFQLNQENGSNELGALNSDDSSFWNTILPPVTANTKRSDPFQNPFLLKIQPYNWKFHYSFSFLRSHTST